MSLNKKQSPPRTPRCQTPTGNSLRSPKPHFPITFSPCVVSNSNTSLIVCHSRSNSHVRSLDHGCSTPASSPRKGAGRNFTKMRPVTAPASGKLECECVGVGEVRPKTPRRVQTSHGTGDGQGVCQKQRTSRSVAPRPRTRTLSVVLPPRKISSVSSTSVMDEDNVVEKEEVDEDLVEFVPVKILSLHYSSTYTPHKSHWVKKALENLGSEWVRNGKLTVEQLVSPEFEEKMGVLYDLSMNKNFEAIDRLTGEEEEGGGGKGGGGEKGRKKKIGRGKGSKKQTGENVVVSGEVQKNFPFNENVTEEVKRKMSDSLFNIMIRDDKVVEKNKDRGDGHATPPLKKKQQQKDQDSGNSTSSNSFEKSLAKKKKSLVQCYVIDGKLVVGTKDKMLSIGGSFVNKFGETGESRARRHPTENRTYFRQTANMMGFLPHEVTIRYCKNSRQLIVSGARPKRDGENARQVRETIEIPKNVDVYAGVLVVLRTSKGSLIFEEIEETEVNFEEPAKKTPRGEAKKQEIKKRSRKSRE